MCLSDISGMHRAGVRIATVTACDVIPSRQALAGSLLDEESQRVEKCLVEALKGKYVVLA